VVEHILISSNKRGVITQLRPLILTNQPNSSLKFAKYLFSPRIYKMSIKSVPPLIWHVNGGDL